MSKQTYSGGCHCGAVRYEANIDFSKGTIRCNCSMCAKSRAWLVAVAQEDFNLKSGADALTAYRFNTERIEHLFCKHCGIKCFGRGKGADGKGMAAVMVSTLENIPDAELAALRVMYVDGRNDNFTKPPAETRYL